MARRFDFTSSVEVSFSGEEDNLRRETLREGDFFGETLRTGLREALLTGLFETLRTGLREIFLTGLLETLRTGLLFGERLGGDARRLRSGESDFRRF